MSCLYSLYQIKSKHTKKGTWCIGFLLWNSGNTTETAGRIYVKVCRRLGEAVLH